MTDNSKTIISLTTIPSRLPEIRPCLESLAIQGPPIHLWLPRYFRRGNEELPRKLPGFLDELNINYEIVEDLGSITKLLPALKLDVGHIITADDDVIYGKNWADGLIKYTEKYPGAVLCYRGRILDITKRYSKSRLLENVTKPEQIDIITGILGAIYKPEFFNDSIWVEYKKWTLNDDLIISAHLFHKGIRMIIIPMETDVHRGYQGIHDIDSLWRINKIDENDAGIKALWGKSKVQYLGWILYFLRKLIAKLKATYRNMRDR